MEDRSSDDSPLEERLLDDILLRRAQGNPVDLEAMLAQLDPSAQARIRARLAGLSDEPRATVLPTGTRLGEFELMEELGRGAMGVVWRAWQPVLRRHVAIKVLPRLAALDPRRVERFQREAKALAALRHPGIVPVLSAGQQDGAFWFAMDLVDGASLATLLASVENRHPAQRNVAELFEPHGIVGPERTPSYLAWVCATLADAADAIAHAHDQGVLHRDLKPSNLMVTRDGRIRIIDFGLARNLTDASESLTQSTDLVGSLAYMAPEQLQKQPAEPSPLADIWSLGVVLYEALAGRRPHVDDDRRVLIAKIAHMPVPRLQRWHARLPRDLVTICHKALEQEPERRYASAAAFAADLRAFLELRPITASAPSWSRRLVLSGRRHPRARLAVAAGLASSMVFSGATAWGAMRHEQDVHTAITGARTAIAAQQFEGAEERLRRLEALAPDHPELAILRGEIAEQRCRLAIGEAEALASEIRRVAELRSSLEDRIYEGTVASTMRPVSTEEEQAHARNLIAAEDTAAASLRCLSDLATATRRSTLLIRQAGPRSAEELRKTLAECHARFWLLATTLRDRSLTEFSANAIGELAGAEAVPRSEGSVSITAPAGAAVFLFRYLQRRSIRESEFSLRMVPVPCRADGTPITTPFSGDFRPGDFGWSVTDPGDTGLQSGDLVVGCDGRRVQPELWVRNVAANSHADRAGVRPWARGLAIDDHPIADWASLRASVRSAEIGEQFTGSVIQNGQTVTWRTVAAEDTWDALGLEPATPAEMLAEVPRVHDLEFDVLHLGQPIRVRIAPGSRGIGITQTIYPLILTESAQVDADAGPLRLPSGEYLVVAQIPGRPLVRDLLDVTHGSNVTVSLAEPEARPEGSVAWVPAGTVSRRHDVASVSALPEQRVTEIPGFWIGTHEVTWAEWREFLTDPEVADQIAAAYARAQRWILWPRDRGETTQLPPRQRGLARAAMKDISATDVDAWLKWRNARLASAGSPFRVRLPSAAEWSRAAGNSSQRLFPFGRYWQPSLMNAKYTNGPKEVRLPAGTNPGDESPFGLLDMAGNVDEWSADEPVPGIRIVKGGSNAHLNPDSFRILAEGSESTRVPFHAGFRLVWYRP